MIQEAFLDAGRRLAEYAADPAMSPFLWLRFLTAQRLGHAAPRPPRGEGTRRGAGGFAPQRAAPFGRLPVAGGPAPGPADDAEPGRDAGRDPDQDPGCTQRDGLVDREILALRHFEELNNSETAAVLGLHKAAASNRYVRALRRLKDILAPTLGLGDGSGSLPTNSVSSCRARDEP